MMALSPEPQTRLIVVALVVSASPALSTACLAGAWPTPAWRTWPIRTSSTSTVAGSRPGPLDGGPDRDAAKFRRGHRAQGATELADGRAGGTDDERLAISLHAGILRRSLLIRTR